MLRFDNPVIAAVRNRAQLEQAMRSEAETVFVLKSNLLEIGAIAENKQGKRVFIHADMCEGIAKDKYGFEYLKRKGIDGIISTKVSCILAAKQVGLSTVHRFFLIDSASVQTALESAAASRPDCAEVMPGVVAKEIARFRKDLDGVSLIAGGLIESKQDVIAALKAGADAVSTGKQELWYE